tara:strand:+ start:386 stop:559 length:174 start_codon:yes stop_codon:yes gene_type:complete
MRAEEKFRDTYGHIKIENSFKKALLKSQELKEQDQELIESMAKDCARHFNRLFKGLK